MEGNASVLLRGYDGGMDKARGSEMQYYDKAGRPTDIEEWLSEFNDRGIAWDVIDVDRKKGPLHIRTDYWGTDFYRWRRLPGEAPEIYETAVINGYPDHLPRRYATAEEALAGHADILALQKRMQQSIPLRFVEALRYVLAELRIGAQRPRTWKWAWPMAAVWAFAAGSAFAGIAGNFASEWYQFLWLNGLVLWLDVTMLVWSIQGLLFLRKRHTAEVPRRAGGPQGE